MFGGDRTMLGPTGLARPIQDLIEELGLGRARADHQNVDPVCRQLRSDRLAEPVDGELAGAVLAVVGNRTSSQDRG